MTWLVTWPIGGSRRDNMMIEFLAWFGLFLIVVGILAVIKHDLED